MAQGRSLWKEVFTNFINSIKPRKHWGELKGKDNLGNEYYEAPDRSYGGKRRRWFIPLKEDVENEIPTEWEAWLRHKRKVPPTEEEIQLNIQKMKNAIENSKRLERQRNKTVKEPESKSSQGSFPKYEEYNTGPFIDETKKIK